MKIACGFCFRHCAAIVVLLAVVVDVAFSNAVFAQPDRRREDAREFQPRTLMSPRRAIVEAPFIRAEQVKGQVDSTELVLGVVVEGQARAYPINMLTGPSREIINDRIGQTDFAATW